MVDNQLRKWGFLDTQDTRPSRSSPRRNEETNRRKQADCDAVVGVARVASVDTGTDKDVIRLAYPEEIRDGLRCVLLAIDCP